MAIELKPCPFCGSNQLSFRSTPDMDTDGKFHRISCNECGASSRATFAMDACPLFYEELRNVWNTRPAPVDANPLASNPVDDKIAPDTDGNAPAATDTGLVTKGFLYQTLTEKNGWVSVHSLTDPAEGGLPYRSIEAVVTRSQAVELLAAERAEKDGWKELHDAAQVAVKERTEACNSLCRQNTDLEAKLAAKDARIKETEDCYLRLCEAIGVSATNAAPIDASEKFRSLEAKLAAAEKALETKGAANEALSKAVVESIDTEKRLREALEAADTAITLADKLIERGYGSDTPREWHKVIVAAQKARAALRERE